MFRVTEVLSDYVDLSMVPPDVLQAAAERGTLVHDICAGILHGFFPPEIPEEAKGYVDSFLIFKEKYIPDVIFGVVLCRLNGRRFHEKASLQIWAHMY